MRRLITSACLAAAVVVPASGALAHSIQDPNKPDGRFMIKGNGYVDVEYNKKAKKFDYVQVYYPCRRAGDPKSKYPAFLSLDTNPRVGLVRGGGSSTFTKKITDTLDTRAVGDSATVKWSVRGVKLSDKGLAATLNVTLSGPAATCPFTLKNKRVVPLLDIPGNS